MKQISSSAPITETYLCKWLGSAMPGSKLQYHRGVLALDCARESQLEQRERAELARVASRASWAAERGLVHLVQRRHGPDDYSYFVVMRPRPVARAAPSFQQLVGAGS
jgi:hypothetical protein